MVKITRYFSYPAGRDRVIKVLGSFSVVGAEIVSTILLVAAFYAEPPKKRAASRRTNFRSAIQIDFLVGPRLTRLL